MSVRHGPGNNRAEGSVVDEKQYIVTNKVRANRINLERGSGVIWTPLPGKARAVGKEILYRTLRSGVTPAALTC